MYKGIDQNTKDLLFQHLEITPDTKVLLVYDLESDLSRELFNSYKKHLSNYQELLFSEDKEEEIREIADNLPKGSLVILIQTGSFRLSKFRWRLELFHRGLKVIEHARLGHNSQDQEQTYIDSLTCDVDEQSRIAQGISDLLDNTQELVFTFNDDSKLVINGPFEETKKNLGVYHDLVNKGGGFPVGEAFVEPKDLANYNGTMRIRAYPSMDHKTIVCEPFNIQVENGKITDIPKDAPQEFMKLVEMLESENPGQGIPLREIGFGVNKYISFDKPLNEVTAFERLRGLHFSLGMKHNIYRKKVPKDVNQRYHIDVFTDIKEMRADDTVFFKEGDYCL